MKIYLYDTATRFFIEEREINPKNPIPNNATLKPPEGNQNFFSLGNWIYKDKDENPVNYPVAIASQQHRRVTSAQLDVLIENTITEAKYQEIEYSQDKFVRRWIDRRVTASAPFYYDDPDLALFLDVLVEASDCSFDESDKAIVLIALEIYSRV